MKKLFAAIFAVALLAPSLANASDMSYIKKLMAKELSPKFSWSGSYIGGQIGYFSGDDTNTFSKFMGSPVVEGEEFTPKHTVQLDGGILGLYGGYNYSIYKNVVLGIETELNYRGVRGDFTYPSLDILLNDNDKLRSTIITSQHLEAKWNGSTRLRIGYDKGRYLPYLSAGISYMVMNVALGNLDAPGVNDNFAFSGWTIGAGLDYALTNNWILRADYRYTSFRKKDFTYANNINNGYFEYAFQKTLQGNDLRLGVSYKF